MLGDPAFLDPRCSAGTLDLFVARRSILEALRRQLPRFTGTVLDVGCGVMPYQPLFSTPLSRVSTYIGLDLPNSGYPQVPGLLWDGQRIPLREASVDGAIATELFEHCSDPGLVMREVQRVLKPGGILFFSVPFLWPLHCVPHDEYRYTPFALERLLRSAGYTEVELTALGGWDASLAQMIGLWVRRRPMVERRRRILAALALPFVRLLAGRDQLPRVFDEGCMITGIAGVALKRAATAHPG
jgi:SAM-dependent methyltransferase